MARRSCGRQIASCGGRRTSAAVTAPGLPEGRAMGNLLPPAWDVPAVFRQRLGDAVGRQRAMASAGHLLLVLHAPPSPGTPERQGRFFWRSPAGEWKANALGGGAGALKKHVAEFAERVDQLEADWQQARSAADF